MFVLRTNFGSELIRYDRCLAVVAWLDARAKPALIVMAVNEAKVRTGVAMLPVGRSRRALAQAANRAFYSLSAGRVVSFDTAAVRSYVTLAARRRAAGRPVSLADGQVAAIAKTNGVAVATGGVRHFESTLGKWVRTIL